MFLDTDFLKTDEIKLVLDKTTEGDKARNRVPAYHFFICNPAGEKVGMCDLRVGYNEQLYYGGHIGYTIFPAHRGNHYAGKACFLLFQLARKHNMEYLYITCNPDNEASRKTCEYAGGRLLKIVSLPEKNEMRQAGSTEKCIYEVILQERESGR